VATHKSAIKRIKTSRRQNERNRRWRSRLRTAIRSVRNAETAEQAQAALALAVPVIDRTANRGIIHPNAAARHKSRLNSLVQSMD